MAERRDLEALRKRRKRAASMLGRGRSQAQVARQLGVSRQSVSRWAGILEAHGPAGLRKARAGRPVRFDPTQRAALMASLKAGALTAGYGTDLWTLKRVARLRREQTGIRYSESGVWHVLSRLGFSCQRPVGRALERDEAAIKHWQRRRWPALKKTPPPAGER